MLRIKKRAVSNPKGGLLGILYHSLCYKNAADKSMCKHVFGSTNHTASIHMLANFCILMGHVCRHEHICAHMYINVGLCVCTHMPNAYFSSGSTLIYIGTHMHMPPSGTHAHSSSAGKGCFCGWRDQRQLLPLHI